MKRATYCKEDDGDSAPIAYKNPPQPVDGPAIRAAMIRAGVLVPGAPCDACGLRPIPPHGQPVLRLDAIGRHAAAKRIATGDREPPWVSTDYTFNVARADDVDVDLLRHVADRVGRWQTKLSRGAHRRAA
jgi:hypothetical protein